MGMGGFRASAIELRLCGMEMGLETRSCVDSDAKERSGYTVLKADL